jgi:hypothetical protein
METWPLSWLATKIFLKKAWAWFKTYWHFPVLLIYTLVMWLVFRKNNVAALAVLKNSQDSYKQQIEVINKSHQKEIQRRNEVIEKYNDIIENIEKDFQDKKETLDKNKKAKIKEIVEKHHDDSEGLAKEIADKFGINYVSQ